MADSDNIGDYGDYGPQNEYEYDGNSERNEDGRSDRRDRDYERQSRRRGDRERSRDEGDRRHRRRSRSRSSSRERRRGRDRDDYERRSRSRNDDRHYSNDDSSSYDSYGSSRRFEDYDHDEGSSSRDEGYYRGRGMDSGHGRIRGNDWRSKLTSIRDAHFNRSKQAPTVAQNQFRNDGSFLEMFKKKMAEQSAKGEDQSSVTPNSLVLASSSIPFSPELSLPPLTATSIDETKPSSSITDTDQDLDGVPMPTHKPIPMPVSVGKRRLAKPLKTGIVIKKPQEPEEDEASQEKLDAWSRYLQEVQKYKSANCVDEDNSRPLVK